MREQKRAKIEADHDRFADRYVKTGNPEDSMMVAALVGMAQGLSTADAMPNLGCAVGGGVLVTVRHAVTVHGKCDLTS